MSTETEKVTSYPLSDVPEFILKGKKSDLSPQELEYQCQKLRDENHQLQLRILGVNELARLLQDRNENVAMLKERNKRLEMSLVRLENRCANFERQIKSQKSNSVASAKPGQSPFIPGPSRQILEGLMQQNAELKKTVNNLQKKGSSGYLEAVKTTQLEEFIEQQKQQIDQLQGQINSLTASADDESAISSGGGMSLPANMAESGGSLKRQLIKMQQTMSVKDRFCTLLSQQVTELQKKLASLQSDKTTPTSEGEENPSGKPISETGGPGEAQYDTLHEELSSSKQQLDELKSGYEAKIADLEKNVRSLAGDKESLEEKYQRNCDLYSTVLSDNEELRNQLDRLRKQVGGDSSSDGADATERLKSQNAELQRILDEQVKNYTLELRSKESDLTSMRIELEDSNMKFMATDSVLTQCRGEMNKLQEKMEDMQDEIDTLSSQNAELNKDNVYKDNEIKSLRFRNMTSQSMIPPRIFTGGAPHLISGVSAGPDIMARDHPNLSKPMLLSRDSEAHNKPGSPGPSNQPQQQAPPPHSKSMTIPLQPNRPEQLPQNTSHRRSPVPQARSGHAQHPAAAGLQTPVTPHTSTGLIGGPGVPSMGGRVYFTNVSSPVPLNPMQSVPVAGRNAALNRFSTQPQPTGYTGTPSPRVGTPGGNMGSPHTVINPSASLGGAAHMGYAAAMGGGPNRTPFMTGSGAPPPPLPPRGQQTGYPQYGGPVFGQFAPMPSRSQYPHTGGSGAASYAQQPQGPPTAGGQTAPGYPGPPELREQRHGSGSTSPHPDPPNMHSPYGGGQGGSGTGGGY